MTATKLTGSELYREAAAFGGKNSILSAQAAGVSADVIFDLIGGNRADVRFTPKATMQNVPR